MGEILEYDLVGRKFRPGSDYAGAEAAFRAAIALDPKDNEIAGNLAILLDTILRESAMAPVPS
jgi:hypothetical protein